jgi:hypothetical protein
VIYPAALDARTQFVLGVLVLAINTAIYAWVWRRWRRATSSRRTGIAQPHERPTAPPPST